MQPAPSQRPATGHLRFAPAHRRPAARAWLLGVWLGALPAVGWSGQDTDPAGTTVPGDAWLPGAIAAVTLDRVSIVGSPADASRIAGAATVLTEADLARFEFTDIQRILRQVPGVSLQVEDGFGLRPNISIRGTASDRSRGVTLLEDGILIAPAPYAAPAAYFFPTPGRLQGVEVLKGPAAILQGPYTTGGAVNLISTRIPDRTGGMFQLEAGSHGHLRGHAWFGGANERGGFVVEGHEWRSDGFQDIDRSDRDTGLNKSDYLARLRFHLGRPEHALELKLRYAEEASNQTYFGLTDADFGADPNRRYGLSELDRIETEHEQVVLSYFGQISDRITLRADAYHNDFERDWFKTEAFAAAGSANAQLFSGTSWFNVIQAVNRGQTLGGLTPAELQAIFDGSADTAPGAVLLRNNAREYYSRGIQTEALVDFQTGALTHALRLGVRYHEDEEDRLQKNSTWTQINGSLVLDDFGLPGNAGNQIEEAEAWAFWIYNRIGYGRLTVSPGLRFETIELKRTRYETRPDRTDDPSRRDPAALRDIRSNSIDVWLPGIGIIFELTPALSLVAGVHEGFSAPSSSPDDREEESTNYEFGVRYDDGRTFIEAIGFWNEYDNLVGICTESSAANCQVGDRFSGEGARVRGLEFLLTRDLSTSPRFGLPLKVVYTFTDGEFRSDLGDSAFFGDVRRGDPIPYLPDHEIFVSLGLERPRWMVNASVNWTDEVCAFARCDAFEQTDALTIVDLSAHFDLTPEVQLYGLVQNLFQEDGIAGRQPRGARPNLDRTLIGGVRVRF